MKKTKKILAGLLVLSIFLSALKFLVFKPKNVLGADVYFGLNEGYGTAINDDNGNVVGTITNAVWKQEEFCKTGKCLYFDGTGDYVSFSDNASLDMGTGETVTVEGWFRTQDISSGTRTLVSKYETSGGDGGYKVYMNSSGFLVFGIDNDNSGFPADSVTSTLSYDDNKWHHFAAVKNGSTSISLYVDAVSVGTPDSSIQNDVSNNDSFFIGSDNGTSNDWSGFIDEVKVLKTARTAAEIKADFTGETPSRGTTALFGPSQDYLSNGLVGYWKMDESGWTNDCSTASVTDSSGNANNGKSCPSTTGPDPSTGKFGNGGSFDGSDDIVTIPDSVSTNITGSGITVSGWFKLDTVSGRNTHLLYKYNNLGGYVLDVGSSGNLAFYVYNGTTSVTAAGGTLSTAQWYHIVGSYDSSDKVKLYINGELINSANASGSISTSSGADLILGAASWQGSNDFPLDGSIDDVRIYNRALSSTEVSKLYNWAPGPVGYWRMDENIGSTTNDTSGNNSILTFTNSPIWQVGKFGNGIQMNGTNSYLTTTTDIDSLDLGHTGYSAFMWQRSSKTATDDMLFSKGATSGTDIGFDLQPDTSGTGRLQLNISDGSTLIVNTLTGTTDVIDGNWHYVGFTWDPTIGAKIYVDGVLENSSSVTSSVNINSASPLLIGGFSSANFTLSGTVDDVKIYNYARSASKVIEDMNGGHPAPGSPVGSAVAKWKFDEGYGTTAHDNNTSTGGAEDLTLSSASWTAAGKFGKAWNGDGTVWLSRTNDADLDFSATESFSISGWFKTDSATNPANGTEYILSTSAGNTDVGYQVYAKNDGTICFAIDDDGTWTDVESCTSTDYYDGLWHHFIASRDVTSDTIKIYIDAVEKDSDTDTTTGTLDGNNIFYIGDFDGDNNATSGTEEFAGDIDEVQIFRSALTLDGIKQLYNQGSIAVMGATSTDSTGNASWSAENEYCPPRLSGTCTPPIAEWKMDENTGTTLQDSTGNGYTSTTWTGNTKFGSGIFGPGLYFDGTNDVVRIDPATSSYLDTIGGTSDSYSVSAWFKTSVTANLSQAIVFKRGSNANTYPFTLSVSGSTKGLDFILNDGVTTCTSTSGVTVNDGKWHFTEGVWDTTTNTSYLYLDGTIVDFDVCSTDPGSMANSSDISIGNGRNDVTDGDYMSFDFNGDIDQVRIYNYARTAPQIAWEFGHGKPTLGWWKLDENISGTGQTIYDSTSYAKNGTTEDGTNNTGMDCTVSGKRNTACDFDGTDDSINIGDRDIYDKIGTDGLDFSIAGWFNRDTFTTDDTIVGIRAAQTVGSVGWLVWIDDSTDKLTFENCDASGLTCDQYMLESASVFTSSGWNHFAIVWDDDDEANTTIYINGVAEAVTKTCLIDDGPSTCVFSDIGNAFANNRNLRIASEHGGTTNNFDGKIDDIMLFSHALNAKEIKNIYNQSAIRFSP